MSTRKRVVLSSTSAKGYVASSAENIVTGKAPIAAKKRPPLGNLTNQRRPSLVPSAGATILKTRKGTTSNISGSAVPVLVNAKTKVVVPRSSSIPKRKERQPTIAAAAAAKDDACVPMDLCSPSLSVTSVSTSNSLKSPDFEYLDENNLGALNSIQKMTVNNLHITEQIGKSENLCKRDILPEIETVHTVVDIDDNLKDPQMCATLACDIYQHLRANEMKKRPSTDFVEKIQEDINASMRSILVDWLVEVAEEYRLVPDTLYLAVNYIDRYLSGNSVNRQRLQLLGIACMMIAAKYEEICAPQVEEYCYITDNTYVKEEVLQMESAVLNYLKFDMAATTTKCFLRRFVRAAQACSEDSPLQLECLANYISELSLLEYHMLPYAASITAASTVFLAKYMLTPSNRPWNPTLKHYTLYEPSHLQECVLALHQLCLNSHSSTLPAVKEKYSQHKYKCVATKFCPPTIPQEYFSNVTVRR